jgi:hypothetical protein
MPFRPGYLYVRQHKTKTLSRASPVKLDAVRTAALALPETTEEPHHNFGSFRVRGKIFVTVPPDNGHIHVFVNEQDRELALAAYPDFTDKLLWGGKVVGVRVALAKAKPAVVKAMLVQAYEHKGAKPAPRKSAKRAPGGPRRQGAA